MSWNKALVVALAVLLVLIGIPVLMPGMGAAGHDCGAALAGSPCGAVIGALPALLAAALWVLVGRHRDPMLGLLLTLRLERPPRLA